MLALSQDVQGYFATKIEDAQNLVASKAFEDILTKYASTNQGRYICKLAGIVPTLTQMLLPSTSDVQILKLVCHLCLDEDCAVEFGLHGLHKAVLNRTMEPEPSSNQVNALTAWELCNEIVDVCSASTKRLGISFPISSNHFEKSLLENRPSPIVVALPHLKSTQGSSQSEPVVLRQVRSPAEARGTDERANFDVGNRLWGASVVLTAWLENHKGLWQNATNILELGAGLGLCGLYVANNTGRNVSSVILSDFNPQIISNLNYNCGVNGHSPERVRAVKLDWDNLKESIELEQCSGNPLPKEYDVVIGSDLICQSSDCTGVARMLTEFLTLDGVAYITLGSEKSRFGVAEFVPTLTQHGLNVSEVSIDLPLLQTENTWQDVVSSLNANKESAASCGTSNDDPWDERIDRFDIGNAASYRHFVISKRRFSHDPTGDDAPVPEFVSLQVS